MIAIIAVAICIGFAVLRFIVPVSGRLNQQDMYKDLAHVWVGILIGAAIYDPAAWWLAGGLTAVEVVAFFVRRRR